MSAGGVSARIAISSIALPGHRAPAAGFDAPFDMLGACHERVTRTLALLTRLLDHVARHGCDSTAQDAACDVMRYFDRAAPLHHEDEERHVFPPLLAGPDSTLHTVVRRLLQDHLDMAQAWGVAHLALGRLRDAVSPDAHWRWTAAEHHALTHFASLYERHLHDEDLLVYPATRQQMTDADLQSMALDMMARRGITTPPEDHG